MPIYARKESFGPRMMMVRVALEKRDWSARKTWVMAYRAGLPGKAPWKRCKWLWMPRHYTHAADPHRVARSNREWLKQHSRLSLMIRPPHLRKPVRSEHA